MEANNVKAMREALEVANETADELLKWIWNHYQELNCMGSRLKRAVEAALSAPPRQCDVGTAEEQLDRYGLFCQNKCPICDNRHSCHICGERYRMKCVMKWAQMPYEGGSK